MLEIKDYAPRDQRDDDHGSLFLVAGVVGVFGAWSCICIAFGMWLAGGGAL